MLTKHKVQELINHMPDAFSVNDLVDELMLLQNVEKARVQAKSREASVDVHVERAVFAMQ
ncbi:hypothetical protein [Mucilaginibacter polytrichastri]|nr:hypothetical protein [Mucilaginibacter polytrichastri]SFS75036.1 hypothetical protein SAMN04487890_103313 [Mucilaginibacter polytrichastri]